MLFDSHCHLDDPRLRPTLDTIIADAERAGVTAFLVPGVAQEGWNDIEALTRRYRQALPAYGVHPMHADRLTPSTLPELRRRARFATAIGEIGLDYLLPAPSRKKQQDAFRAQLEIAAETGLPVLLHCRRAFEDLTAMVMEAGIHASGGVMHSFSGSVETAMSCLKAGLHISLSGTVTYANAKRPVQVAAAVPLERLLLETDAPDLSPEPHRGEVNVPAHLLSTARRVAEIRGIPIEEVARITSDNARRLFKLDSSLRPRFDH